MAAVPSFRPRWQQFLTEWQGEEIPWYFAMGELAHYVVDEYESGATSQFAALFAAVESLYQTGDLEIQNLIWFGLFEGIQNIASHRPFGSAVFRPWLGPQSVVAWDGAESGARKIAAWTASQRPRWWQFWRRLRRFDPNVALAKVENPELRKIIEQAYRKME